MTDERDTIIDDSDGPRIARYLTGSCTPQEANAFRAWIASDPRRVGQVEEFVRVWEATAPAPDDRDVDAAWAALVAARASRQSRAPRDGGHLAAAFRPSERRVGWAVGLSGAAFVVIAALWLWRGAPSTRTGAVAQAAHEYVTPRGRRETVQLADSTRVTLGPASWLRVSAAYGTSTREVTLDGEALLDVTNDSRRPFRVRTRHALVEVVRTIFDVRAYASDSATTVVVSRGRVVVRSERATAPRSTTSSPTATLDAGSLAVITADTVRVEYPVDVVARTAWSGGSLVFRDTPLRDALPEIERWYDVDIRLADTAYASRRITATFSSEPVDLVLRLVTESIGLTYERQGGVVVVGRSRGR